MARVMRQRQNYQANFTLKQYQTWKKAERAAKKWLRQKLKELPPEIPQKGRKTKRNKTGKVGVHFKVDLRPPGSDREDYSYYISSWINQRGERETIRFSCNKFGKRQAFRLANIARDHETTDRSRIFDEYKRKTGQPVEV